MTSEENEANFQSAYNDWNKIKIKPHMIKCGSAYNLLVAI